MTLDFDQHYGDGTHDIIERPYDSGTITNGAIENISGCGKEIIQSGWVANALSEISPNVVLYQGGADQRINDPLGGLFTDDELRIRDREVFRACEAAGIPVGAGRLRAAIKEMPMVVSNRY